jgi:hypothetical protein
VDDLLLYSGNVLLPDVHLSGIDNGLPSFCLWVPWYLQKGESERRRRQGRSWNTRPSPCPGGSGGDSGDNGDGGRDRDVGYDANSVAFFRHNPTGWMTEPSVAARTATMLLKWYPIGAFQRQRSCCHLCLWGDVKRVEKEERVEKREGGNEDVDDRSGGGRICSSACHQNNFNCVNHDRRNMFLPK